MAGLVRMLALALACAVLAATGANAACAPAADPAQWVDGGGTCLVISVAGAESAGSSPSLVVLLHGDVSDGGPADYLYPVAQQLARPGVVVVALLRPGYFDARRRTSQGSDNQRRDSYTSRNVTIVGKAIAALKARYKAGRVVVMGHSGGAAIAGVLIGREQGLVDAAVLVSCPCDIPRWRAQRKARPWPNSLSPHSFAATVPRSTRVVTITGSDDENTRPGLAAAYVGALVARRVEASAQVVQGAGHGFRALSPAATAAIGRLL